MTRRAMKGRPRTRFEGQPLEGLCIAVTRPEGQAPELMAGLRELGARPLSCPTIRIEEPADRSPVERAVRHLNDYDWVVFTSANGVARFWDELVRSGGDGSWPAGTRLAAIGPATAGALVERGVRPEVVPATYVAEAVAVTLAELDIAGQRVLLPRAAGARAVLPERLRAAGAQVDDVVAYVSSPEPEGIARLRSSLEQGGVDMVTFTAPSTVRHFVEATGAEMGRARVAAIGPITAENARALGVRVDIVAEDYTVHGLLRAICEFYAAGGAFN